MPGTLQEGGAPFQTTHWTVVLQAGQVKADEASRKALATFSETYWPPLYTFVRRRGYSPADAQDIVQGFFVHLFEHNTLTRADQEKGRLRTFLLGSLQKFLLKQRERMSAIKRGGNQQLVSFDLHLPETDGFHSFGSLNRLDGNTALANSGTGFLSNGAIGDYVVRNTAGANTVANYTTTGGNVGPIQSASTAMSACRCGLSAGMNPIVGEKVTKQKSLRCKFSRA